MRPRLLIFLLAVTAATWATVLNAQPNLAFAFPKLAALQLNDTGSNAPPSPTLQPASNVTVSGFTVNWNPVDTALNYYVEVASSADFSQIVWSGSTYYSNTYSLSVQNSYSGVFLQPGTTYYFRVSSNGNYNNQDQSTPSTVGSVTTDPFPGPLVTGTSNITANSFTVSWIPVPEASSYAVDVSTTPDFGNIVASNVNVGNGTATCGVANPNANWYGWGSPPLQQNTTYYYRLYAQNNSTNSSYSLTQTVTTAVLPAPVVTGTSNITSSSFTATWTPVDEATSYFINVSTTPDFGNLVVDDEYLGDNTTTSATINLIFNTWDYNGDNLPPSGTYYYQIWADDNGAMSANSTTQVITTPTYAGPVLNAATNITRGGFTSSWSAVPGADSQTLWISTTPDTNNAITGFDFDGITTNFTITPPDYQYDGVFISPGTTYYFWITATSGSVGSLPSNIQSVTTLPFPAPQLNDASNITIDSFTLNWQPVPDATGYEISISTTPDFGNLVATPYVDGGNTTSFTLPNDNWWYFTPDPGTTYYYQIRADDGTLVSDYSTAQSVSTLVLAAPQVDAATLVTANDFTVNWEDVPGADSYYIDISTTPDFGNLVLSNTYLGDGNTTSSDYSGHWWFSNVLNPGTSYYYRIYAQWQSNSSPYSATQSITTLPFPPPQSNTPINITSTSFTANWSPVPGATGYSMELTTDPNATFAPSDFLQYLGDGNTTSAGWPYSLQPNTTYYYCIFAQGPNYLYSLPSNENSFTTNPIPAPQLYAPSNITPGSFTASWSAVPGANGYTLTVYSSGYGITQEIQADDIGNNTVEYTVTADSWWLLTPGSTLSYSVQANIVQDYWTSYSSDSSNTQTVTTLAFPAPQSAAASNITHSTFVANWATVTGAIGYSIDVSTTSDFTQLVISGQYVDGGNTTSATVSSPDGAEIALEPGTTYYYRVSAVGPYVDSDYSSTQSFITKNYAAPHVNSATNATFDSFTLNWSPLAGATGYYVDISTSADFSQPEATNLYLGDGNSTSTSITDFGSSSSGIQPGTTYYYRIHASVANFTSPNSTSKSVTTLTFPTPQVDDPSNIALSSFTANWEPLPGMDGFYIDVSSTPDFGNLVISGQYLGDGNTTSATVSVSTDDSDLPPLQPNTTYYYRIYAQAGGLTSPYSDTQTVTTADFPGPQVDAATNITYFSFDANWEPVAGADSYYIDVSSTSDFGNLVLSASYLGDGNTTSTTVSAPYNYWDSWIPYFQPDTTYYYRIYAESDNLASDYSDTQTITTAVFAAPVVDPTTYITPGGFTVNWEPVTGATGYSIDVSTTPDFGNLVYSNYTLGDGSTTSADIVSNNFYIFENGGWQPTSATILPNTTYYYRIYAQSNNLNSLASTPQTVTTDDLPAPEVSDATDIAINSFTANWIPVPNATDYTLDLSTTPDFGNLVLSNYDLGDGTTPGAEIDTPPNNGGYYGGGGIYGGGGGVIFEGGGSSLTTVGEGEIILNDFVVNSAGASSTSGSGGNATPAVTTPTTIQPNTTYYYRIRANWDNNVFSNYSDPQTVTTADFPAPLVSSATNITYTGFTANWDLVADAASYSMDVSTTPDFGNIVDSGIYIGDDNTTSVDTDGIDLGYYYQPLILQAGTTYYYRIYANGSNTTTSDYSTTQSITTLSFPTPVVDTATSITPNDFTVNWETVPNATGYSVDVSTTADFEENTTLSLYFDGGDTQSGDIDPGYWYNTGTNLQPNTTYYYRVYADGPNYSSQPSDGQSVTTATFTPPTGENTANVTANSFTASWSAITGASNYLLTVSSTADFGNIVFTAAVGNTTCYTVSNLQAGTNYYYQVNAYDSDMGYSGYSSSANTTTAALAPGSLTYADWTESVDLTGETALPQAKPFSDGLTNLAHYAMNLGPSPSSNELPTVAPANLTGVNYLTLQYRQRKSLNGYQLVAQSSTDLINWTIVPSANIIQLTDDDADTARYEACVAIPSQGSVYLRVQVVTTPK